MAWSEALSKWPASIGRVRVTPRGPGRKMACGGYLRCQGPVQVAGKRWVLDLNARQEASLQLSSVNLPGGVQVLLPHQTPSMAVKDAALIQAL